VAGKSILESVLDSYEDRLSSLPNVVGLGIVSLDEADMESEHLAVGVYVSQKIPQQELNESELIPKYLEVQEKGQILQIPIRVIEQGEVKLEDQGIGKETL
jgi:hypothetical protein